MKGINIVNTFVFEDEGLSFEDFFCSTFPAFSNFAMRYLVCKEVAKDIVQDSFIEFYYNSSRFKTMDQGKCFLYTVIRNKCLNYLKHRKVVENYDRNFVRSDQYFKDSVIEEETKALVQQYIYQLPPQSRSIILYCMHDKPNQEIAEILNISINTVKTLKRKSYRFLREKLVKYI
jgi:RNA polymerase sigma-70 factor (family 1)